MPQHASDEAASIETADPMSCGPVIYLDFDGVLHHENVLWRGKRGAYLDAPVGHRLFQYAGVLTEMLGQYEDIGIVLSTAWTLRYGCAGAARRLPHELRRRVVGATFHSSMERARFLADARGMQVWSDVHRREPRDWMALDDDVFGWPAWCRDKLIPTHPVWGISPMDVQEKIREGLSRISSAKRLNAE